MHNYSCTMMKMNDLKNVKESQFTNTITLVHPTFRVMRQSCSA